MVSGLGTASGRGAGFPRAEFERRWALVEAALERAGLDALIAYSVGNQQGPCGYLAGYEPRFGQRDVSVLVLVPGRRPTLLAYAYWDRPASRTWVDDVIVDPSLPRLAVKLAEIVPAAAKRIGVAGLLFFPASLSEAIAAARPGCAIEDATSLVTDVARIKCPQEIEVLRECARMTDAGVRAFLDDVRQGADERVIALDVERAMVMAGAERPAFPPLVFSREQVEVGIGFASSRPLRKGDPVNVVCGAEHRGYKMDVGRVTAVGKPSDRDLRLMDAVAEMLHRTLEVVAAGVPAEAVGAPAARVIKERGLEEWTYRGGPPGFAGHGIGCWLDEPPTLKLGEATPLEAGMVLILEARLGRTGRGGAHITEPVLVTASGAERLGTVPIVTWQRA
jgi:Xaa-Pro aminopeptidase